jgi:hypothetical protein
MYRKFDVTGNLFFTVHFSMDLNIAYARSLEHAIIVESSSMCPRGGGKSELD